MVHACQAVGTLDELIEHVEVATRSDSVEDFRSQLLCSVHPDIIAGVMPIRDRGEIAQMPLGRVQVGGCLL